MVHQGGDSPFSFFPALLCNVRQRLQNSVGGIRSSAPRLNGPSPRPEGRTLPGLCPEGGLPKTHVGWASQGFREHYSPPPHMEWRCAYAGVPPPAGALLCGPLPPDCLLSTFRITTAVGGALLRDCRGLLALMAGAGGGGFPPAFLSPPPAQCPAPIFRPNLAISASLSRATLDSCAVGIAVCEVTFGPKPTSARALPWWDTPRGLSPTLP